MDAGRTHLGRAGLNPSSTAPNSGVSANGYNGKISAIAVDPVDPSGNIVYIGAA